MIVSGILVATIGLVMAASGAYLLVRLDFRSKGTLLKYHAEGEGKPRFEDELKRLKCRASKFAVKAGIRLFASKDLMDINAPGELEEFSHRFWGTVFILLGTFLQVLGVYLLS